ncbi:MAG TPA: hypothetical protein VN700_06420 [Vicinamibacterales bacterium]|nr:hypothetical protein [Vicinamibacterales bacterium]
MLLQPAVLLATGFAGWALGRSGPVLQLPAFALTLFAAVTAHSGFQWAFIDGTRMDTVVGDPRDGAPAVAVILIAAIEAVGLWLPFLILPWAQASARVWGAAYILSACTAAAATHYFPFDAGVFDGQILSPDGPPYLLAAFACLPVAAVGYLIGWKQRQFARFDD